MMMVAYELKRPLQEIANMSLDEFGWWIAFFQRKLRLEKEAASRRR